MERETFENHTQIVLVVDCGLQGITKFFFIPLKVDGFDRIVLPATVGAEGTVEINPGKVRSVFDEVFVILAASRTAEDTGSIRQIERQRAVFAQINVDVTAEVDTLESKIGIVITSGYFFAQTGVLVKEIANVSTGVPFCE